VRIFDHANEEEPTCRDEYRKGLPYFQPNEFTMKVAVVATLLSGAAAFAPQQVRE
jgi:hypothetical protein